MPKKTMGDPRGHYVELDAMRGIAILGVVMSHIAASWMNNVEVPLKVPWLRWNGEDTINLLFFFGSVGLSLFFALSGYLLTWTEERRARSGIYSVRSYVLRRVFRLMPAYYVAILIVIVLWPIEVSATDVLWHVSFLHALNPVSSLDPVWWSLTPEVIFYCLLPFIVLKLPRVSQRLALFGVFALISLAARLYLYMMQFIPDLAKPPPFEYWVVLPQLTIYLYIFLAGVLLRMLVEYLSSRPASRLQPRLATGLFLVGAVSVVTLLYLGMKHPTIAILQGETSWPLVGIPLDLLAIAFFTSVLLGSPLLRAVLRWRFLTFTGMISYSMFVLHETVLVIVAPRYFLPVARDWVAGQGSLAVLAIFSCYALAILTIVFPISYLSYRYVESPFLSYKPK